MYLSVTHPFSQGNLLFFLLHPALELVLNQYRILEPKLDVRDILSVHMLDVICTLLVAFDKPG